MKTPRVLLIVVAAAIAACMIGSRVNVPDVQAQSFEPFYKVFNVPASGSVQYIPSCTTGTAGCIPNFKQVGHSVTEQTAAGVSGFCQSLLDFSVDNVKFSTLAAGTTSTLNTQGVVSYSANGYYNYYRIKVGPCNAPQTITYVGYSNVLPLQNISTAGTDTITGPVPVLSNLFVPAVIQSFTCLNTNSSAAYLQLMVTPTSATPTLGGASVFLQIPLAGSAEYTFPVNLTLQSLSQIAGYNYLWIGAATAFSGSTPVTNPVYCTFQFNLSGPYTPFNPPSS
jgi:hypothetical protein